MTDKPLYRLIDKDGTPLAYRPGGNIIEFVSVQKAAQFARDMWPDQEQDEDRTGKGWDVEAVKDEG